jgi:hypothetical protein
MPAIRKAVVLSLLSFFIVWAESGAGQLKIEITAPSDRAAVPQRPIVEGRVSDPASVVWVVIHPLEVSDYYVQPRANVRGKGDWKVEVYIGRPGNLDIGKAFEIRAVANPEGKLREGKILPDWPKASAISEVIEVTRK